MISKELFFYDCFGLYHKRNAFSKDQIDQANEIFDTSKVKRRIDEKVKHRNVFESNGIFFRLSCHPEIIKMCEMCLGENFRLDLGFILNDSSTVGNQKNAIHGKRFGKENAQYHISFPRDNAEAPCKISTGNVSVGIILKSQKSETGGFCYIKGSHKTSYMIKGQEVKKTYLNDDDAFNNIVTVPNLEAGDLIMFSESLWHGQTKMSTEEERRIIYAMFYSGHSRFAKWEHGIEQLKKYAHTDKEKMILQEPYVIGDLTDKVGTTKDTGEYIYE